MWIQLKTFFVEGFKVPILNDLRLANVGVKDGVLKLFDYYELNGPDSNLDWNLDLNELARTFTNNPQEIAWLLGKENHSSTSSSSHSTSSTTSKEADEHGA